MTKQKLGILTAGLLLIGMAAAFLTRLEASHKLGKPGLKMVDKLVYDDKGNVVGTNTVDLPSEVLTYSSEIVPVSGIELGMLPADTTYAKRAFRDSDGFGIMLGVVMM